VLDVLDALREQVGPGIPVFAGRALLPVGPERALDLVDVVVRHHSSCRRRKLRLCGDDRQSRRRGESRSGRVGAAAAARALALLHAAQDRLPTVLEIAEREALNVRWQPEAGLHGVHVDAGLGRVDADLADDALAVPL